MEFDAPNPFMTKYHDKIVEHASCFDTNSFPRALNDNKFVSDILGVMTLVLMVVITVGFGTASFHGIQDVVSAWFIGAFLAGFPASGLIFLRGWVRDSINRDWRHFEESFTSDDIEWIAATLRDYHKLDLWKDHLDSPFIRTLVCDAPNQIALSLLSDDQNERIRALEYCFWFPWKNEPLSKVPEKNFWSSVKAALAHTKVNEKQQNTKQRLASLEPVESN